MIAEQTYHKVKSVDEAINLAIHHPNDFRYLAGGTDVIVNQFQGNDQKDCLIDISGIEELKQIKVVGHNLHIGSLVTLDSLKNHEVIAKNFPQLLEAAHSDRKSV